MYSLNRATLLGNVTRDPEVRQTPNGQSVASFSVATNRSWSDAAGQKQEAVEYHNVVAWAKLADICRQYLTKGKKVYVEGRIQTRDWEGPDGVRKYRTEIVAESLILLDRGGAPSSATNNAPSYVPIHDPAPDASQEIRVEDIPF